MVDYYNSLTYDRASVWFLNSELSTGSICVS